MDLPDNTHPSQASGVNNGALRWVSHGVTDVGKTRKLNEDAFLERADIGLWAVADGMGGHSAGDVASRMLISALRGLPRGKQLSQYIDDIETRILQVNTNLRERAAQAEKKIIGTTVILLAIYENYGVFFWVGDSRLYRLRGEQLYQLSIDHTQVAEYLEQGMITPDQALTHPFRHRITRAVGGCDQMFLDLDMTRVEQGDRYLLCSDGLTGYATELEIRDILRASPDTSEACSRLLELVHSHGAGDNTTMIVIDVQPTP